MAIPLADELDSGDEMDSGWLRNLDGDSGGVRFHEGSIIWQLVNGMKWIQHEMQGRTAIKCLRLYWTFHEESTLTSEVKHIQFGCTKTRQEVENVVQTAWVWDRKKNSGYCMKIE